MSRQDSELDCKLVSLVRDDDDRKSLFSSKILYYVVLNAPQLEIGTTMAH